MIKIRKTDVRCLKKNNSALTSFNRTAIFYKLHL